MVQSSLNVSLIRSRACADIKDLLPYQYLPVAGGGRIHNLSSMEFRVANSCVTMQFHILLNYLQLLYWLIITACFILLNWLIDTQLIKQIVLRYLYDFVVCGFGFFIIFFCLFVCGVCVSGAGLIYYSIIYYCSWGFFSQSLLFFVCFGVGFLGFFFLNLTSFLVILTLKCWRIV